MNERQVDILDMSGLLDFEPRRVRACALRQEIFQLRFSTTLESPEYTPIL